MTHNRWAWFAIVMICGVGITARSAVAETPKRIAVVTHVWSGTTHASVIATKFFTGFPTDQGLLPPKVQVASIYIDQPTADDIGHLLAKKHDVPIYSTVVGALTLGGKELAVDGVLYIGEHGEYPRSRLGAKMYPRMNILEQVFRVFDASGRSVPVFNDKHLAYSWLDSKWVYDRARELNVPMMAGSSLPVSWRKPMSAHPTGAKITEAVAVGHGALDSYGFHALEILQSMTERRAGGESGVASVQCLRGQAVYEAANAGRFSMKLVEAAAAGCPNRKGKSMAEVEQDPTAVLVAYRDGTKGVMVLAGRYVGEYWGYAARVDGKVEACEFAGGPKPIYAHFSYLGLNAQDMFLTGKPRWPVERTLLTSGVLDAALRSERANGVVHATPYLEDVRYHPMATDPIRPNAPEPTGASLGPWPPSGYEFILAPKSATPSAPKQPAK